uniref:L-Fucosyltransferase n=1 Tax=Ditylenchus dipsaci TaxID=166011 RepID=A0A915DS75_9BILA
MMYICIAITIIVVLALWRYTLELSHSIKWPNNFKEYLITKNTTLPVYNHYISPTITLCGGMGNMMWRFASVYGIGRQTGRSPYFHDDASCMKDTLREANETFPEYAKRMKFLKAGDFEKDSIEFGNHCCKYEDLKKYHKKSTKKYVQLSGYYFQSYKYFDEVADEIRQIFAWAPAIRNRTEAYGNKLFNTDKFHKLCVHTRLGDFVSLNIHSRLNFTEEALMYVFRQLKKNISDVSVVLLGEDKEFLKSIKYNKEEINKVYIPKKMSRGEDMAFASIHCNSLLLTAQASTFGWWIGYLMESYNGGAPGAIYYNSDFQGNSPADTYTFENYPRQWITLKLKQVPVIIEGKHSL